MPKLPQFSQSNIISPVTSGPLNTTQERLEGETIAQLGRSISSLGRAVGAKRRSDTLLSRREIEAIVLDQAIRAKKFSDTNVNAHPNGSDTEKDFDSVFNQVDDRIAAMGLDSDLLRHAEQIKKSTKNKFLPSLVKSEIDKGIFYQGVAVEKGVRNATEVINLDGPSEANIAQAEGMVLKTLGDSLLTNEQQLKVFEQFKKEEAPKAAINHYLEKENPDFSSARKVLDSSLGKRLTSEQRRHEFNKIKSFERSFQNAQIRKENALRLKEERLKKKQQQENFDKIMIAKAIESDPAKLAQMDTQLSNMLNRGEITFAMWQTSQRESAAVPEAENTRNLSKYVHRMYVNRNMKNIVSDIYSDIESGNIRRTDGMALIQSIRKDRRVRASLDPILRRKLKNSEEAILKFVGKGSKTNAFGQPILNPVQARELKNHKDALAEAAARGPDALDQTFDRITRSLGDDFAVLGLKVPEGVHPKNLKSRSSVEREFKRLRFRYKQLQKTGTEKTFEGKRIEKTLRELVPYLDHFEEKEQRKEEFRGSSNKTQQGKGSRRRRRRRGN